MLFFFSSIFLKGKNQFFHSSFITIIEMKLTVKGTKKFSAQVEIIGLATSIRVNGGD